MGEWEQEEGLGPLCWMTKYFMPVKNFQSVNKETNAAKKQQQKLSGVILLTSELGIILNRKIEEIINIGKINTKESQYEACNLPKVLKT